MLDLIHTQKLQHTLILAVKLEMTVSKHSYNTISQRKKVGCIMQKSALYIRDGPQKTFTGNFRVHFKVALCQSWS